MFKKILIGVAAGAGILALGYVGLIAYTTHAICQIKLGNLHDEQEVE